MAILAGYLKKQKPKKPTGTKSTGPKDATGVWGAAQRYVGSQVAAAVSGQQPKAKKKKTNVGGAAGGGMNSAFPKQVGGALGGAYNKATAGKKKVTAAKPKTSSSSSGGTSGGGGTRVGAAAPAAVGRPSGTSPAARNRAKNNTAAGRQAGAEAAAKKVEEIDPITQMFGAARRAVEDNAKRQAAIYERRMQETAKFEEYLRQAREAGNNTLSQQFAASAEDAKQARAAGDARINDLINNAKALVGNPDAQRQSGMQANEQAFGFQQSADGYRSAANAFSQSALAERNVNDAKVDAARAQELRDNTDNRYQVWLNELSKQRGELDTNEMKARIEQSNADRQYALDQQAAQFLQQYKQGELGVKQAQAQTAQYNAETNRIKAINQSNYQNESLKLKKQVEQGKLDARQAELQLKAGIAKANITQKEKDRLTKLGIARIRAAGSSSANPSKDSIKTVRDYLAGQLEYLGSDWGGIDDHQRSETIRGAITALATQNPNMKATQAMAVLASVFGGAPMNSNPQYKQMILSYFN